MNFLSPPNHSARWKGRFVENLIPSAVVVDAQFVTNRGRKKVPRVRRTQCWSHLTLSEKRAESLESDGIKERRNLSKVCWNDEASEAEGTNPVNAKWKKLNESFHYHKILNFEKRNLINDQAAYNINPFAPAKPSLGSDSVCHSQIYYSRKEHFRNFASCAHQKTIINFHRRFDNFQALPSIIMCKRWDRTFQPPVNCFRSFGGVESFAFRTMKHKFRGISCIVMRRKKNWHLLNEETCLCGGMLFFIKPGFSSLFAT